MKLKGHVTHTCRYMNRCFSCLHKDDLESQNDGLFIRVNGKDREAVAKIWIRKGHELRYLKEMNRYKTGRVSKAMHN